ncbi:MAG: hypothetical protein OSB33_06655, partial [Candidatus Poseidoniales archaeon]|nr:hypothetical protein [Candidatus Poseidoniales archaeon]
VEDGTCVYPEPEPEPPIEGCMDSNATNFDNLAVVEDGTCVYPEPELEDNNTVDEINDLQNSGAVADGFPWVKVGVLFIIFFIGIGWFSVRKRFKNG